MEMLKFSFTTSLLKYSAGTGTTTSAATSGTPTTLQTIKVLRSTEDGDAKAVENSSLGKKIDAGKHKPRNVLEFIRFIHGYYK